jgi:hypothetical protein
MMTDDEINAAIAAIPDCPACLRPNAASRAIYRAGMRVRLDAVLRDAERYRWLRSAGAWESEVGLVILSERPNDFDAAVDAAMKYRA